MSASRTTWRIGLPAFLAAALAAVLLASVPGHAASAVTATAGGGSSPKPVIVLEHGAWADASSWAEVIAGLQRRGFTVDAPPNPLRGVTYDSTYLKDFLSTIPGPIVLVGHSYGGFVITNAATGNPNVKALVYVDAFIPDQGDTLLGLLDNSGSCLGGNPADVFNFAPYPGGTGGPTGDVDTYIKPSLVPSCFASGLPAPQAAVIAAIQRPLAASTLGEPSGPPAWTTIPSWAVVGTADRVIPPALLTSMAQHAGAHITDVNAGHLSMISRANTVTKVIIDAANATG
jgi:pimeloyl-ACP methyl ester carboxylesterase